MIDHLIFAPHHDDAEFGLGGTIQRLRARDEEIEVVVCAAGDYVRADGRPVTQAERERESQAALQHLGVNAMRLVPMMAENGGRAADFPKMVATIEAIIGELFPACVYVCLPSSNQDHQVLYEAVIAAFRPGRDQPALLAYEYPGNCWGPPPPAFGKRYVPLTAAEASRKLEALEMHVSQFEGRTAGVAPEAARVLAMQRGAEIARPFAELIYVLKETI